jgi:hypothetical protein
VACTRRRFLATGVAAIAGAMCLTGCPGNPGGRDSSPRPRQECAGTTSARFEGDPGSGHVLYGASLPYTSSLPSFERELGRRLQVHRSYFSAGQSDSLLAAVRDDHANQRLSLASSKCPGTWAQVAEGRWDEWLRNLLQLLSDERYPILLALHHEPENDAGGDGMSPGDWVAMQSHAIWMSRQLGETVTIVPILMHFTVSPASGRDPAQWLVPDSQVFGLDVYNHWSPDNGASWSEFGAQVDEAWPWADGKPVIIAEYGCREDPAEPGRASAWMHEAYNYAQAHDMPILSYFDSWQNSPDGTWELDGERLTAFKALLKASRDGRTAVTTQWC